MSDQKQLSFVPYNDETFVSYRPSEYILYLCRGYTQADTSDDWSEWLFRQERRRDKQGKNNPLVAQKFVQTSFFGKGSDGKNE